MWAQFGRAGSDFVFREHYEVPHDSEPRQNEINGQVHYHQNHPARANLLVWDCGASLLTAEDGKKKLSYSRRGLTDRRS